MQRIRRHLQSEESGVYRYLPAQRDDAAPAPPLSPPAYSRDAREIGDGIFRGRPLDDA